MGNSIETLAVYNMAVEISDLAWEIYQQLPQKYRYCIGDQTLRSADSVAANIAEGYGRHTSPERIRFLFIARGSLYELNHWIETLQKRNLISDGLVQKIMHLIKKEMYTIHKYAQYLRNTSPKKPPQRPL